MCPVILCLLRKLKRKVICFLKKFAPPSVGLLEVQKEVEGRLVRTPFFATQFSLISRSAKTFDLGIIEGYELQLTLKR